MGLCLWRLRELPFFSPVNWGSQDWELIVCLASLHPNGGGRSGPNGRGEDVREEGECLKEKVAVRLSLFGGHTCLCLGITPSSTLRDQTWQLLVGWDPKGCRGSNPVACVQS